MDGERDIRKVHAFEQLTGVFDDLSASLYTYLQKLEAQGFTREESMRLILRAQDRMIGNLPVDED